MAINFPSNPTLDQEYSADDRTWKWNGIYWEAITATVGYAGSVGFTGSKGESSFSLGPTPPDEPIVGDRWLDTESGCLVVWTEDADSFQWVEVAASGYRGPTGYTGSAGVVEGLPPLVTADLRGSVIGDDSTVIVDYTSSLITASKVTTPIIESTAAFTEFTQGVFVTGATDLGLVSDRIVSIQGASGTVTHDVSVVSLFYHTSVAGDFTANLVNVPDTDDRSTVVSLIIQQSSTARVVVGLQIEGAAQTILWSDGVTPVGSANKTDIFSFTLIRSSNTWLVLGSAGSFG